MIKQNYVFYKLFEHTARSWVTTFSFLGLLFNIVSNIFFFFISFFLFGYRFKTLIRSCCIGSCTIEGWKIRTKSYKTKQLFRFRTCGFLESYLLLDCRLDIYSLESIQRAFLKWNRKSTFSRLRDWTSPRHFLKLLVNVQRDLSYSIGWYKLCIQNL